jgi:chemotaxis protein CheZ
MSNFSVLKGEYGIYLEAMGEAFQCDDEAAFFTAVDRIVQMREPKMLSEIRKLTGDLHKALERFSIESRLADFAAHDIPGARARLAHVIDMTDKAAHRTLDLVEQSGPLAERTARAAGNLLDSLTTARSLDTPAGPMPALEPFLTAARADCEQIRRNLSDVLLAQGYQDLTGQIIRSVIQLVGELERTLGDLHALSGDAVEQVTLGDDALGAHGPAIPGVTRGEVASAQTDVDALFSGLGI